MNFPSGSASGLGSAPPSTYATPGAGMAGPLQCTARNARLVYNPSTHNPCRPTFDDLGSKNREGRTCCSFTHSPPRCTVTYSLLVGICGVSALQERIGARNALVTPLDQVRPLHRAGWWWRTGMCVAQRLLPLLADVGIQMGLGLSRKSSSSWQSAVV